MKDFFRLVGLYPAGDLHVFEPPLFSRVNRHKK